MKWNVDGTLTDSYRELLKKAVIEAGDKADNLVVLTTDIYGDNDGCPEDYDELRDGLASVDMVLEEFDEAGNLNYRFVLDLLEDDDNSRGLIVIEYPHQGLRRVWSVDSINDFIHTVYKTWSSSRPDGDEPITYDQCVEWLGHDLKQLTIIKHSKFSYDFYAEDADVLNEADFLGWI